jgi:hypothetical protein
MPGVTPPEYRESNLAAVRLLQGAVYDDDRVWELVRASEPDLARLFARLGLLLVVDEAEGLAYLRQMGDGEITDGYDVLPKLFRKTRLGYGDTLLCVLLRDELRRFEEEHVGARCAVEAAGVFDRWHPLAATRADAVAARREFSAALARLEKMGFVRQCGDEPETWEVLRVLKARLPVAELENLKARLLDARGRRGATAEGGDE